MLERVCDRAKPRDNRKQLRRVGTPGPKVIGIDEISIRKRHTYRIVVSDLERRRPIRFGGNGRAEADMDGFFTWLGAKNSSRILALSGVSTKTGEFQPASPTIDGFTPQRAGAGRCSEDQRVSSLASGSDAWAGSSLTLARSCASSWMIACRVPLSRDSGLAFARCSESCTGIGRRLCICLLLRRGR